MNNLLDNGWILIKPMAESDVMHNIGLHSKYSVSLRRCLGANCTRSMTSVMADQERLAPFRKLKCRCLSKIIQESSSSRLVLMTLF